MRPTGRNTRRPDKCTFLLLINSSVLNSPLLFDASDIQPLATKIAESAEFLKNVINFPF